MMIYVFRLLVLFVLIVLYLRSLGIFSAIFVREITSVCFTAHQVPS